MNVSVETGLCSRLKEKKVEWKADSSGGVTFPMVLVRPKCLALVETMTDPNSHTLHLVLLLAWTHVSVFVHVFFAFGPIQTRLCHKRM